MEVLDLRQLNRATLARQALLERSIEPIDRVLHEVGGLQAQLPAPPLVGLWSRSASFRRELLLDAVRAGRVVRGTTLRGTLHLHSVDDYRALRMGLQTVLDAHVRSLVTRGVLTEHDVAAARTCGSELLTADALTVAQLKTALAARIPGRPPQALMSVARHALQLLLVPDPDRPDGWSATAPFTDARRIVGDTLAEPATLETFVRRFMEVLGPGTAQDVQTWCGLRRIAPVMQRMHDAGELIELTTWEGASVWDLPTAPRPSGDASAPPRFLPMWDNVLLSHADRSRIVHPDWRPYLASRNGMSPPTFLIDGFVHGTWSAQRTGGAATLELAAFARVPARFEEALVAEGERLLNFLHPDVGTRRVRFV